jgi:hypothetical protein
MEYDKLKEKVKMLGFRVTKDVKGKRVKLTKKELAAKLPKKMKAQPSLENQAKSAKKFIKVCKMVLREAEPTQPRAPRVVQQPVRVCHQDVQLPHLHLHHQGFHKIHVPPFWRISRLT